MGKVKENKSTPHFCSLPQGERRDERVSLTLTLSRGVERKDEKKRS
jgi:hypothetical protein